VGEGGYKISQKSVTYYLNGPYVVYKNGRPFVKQKKSQHLRTLAFLKFIFAKF